MGQRQTFLTIMFINADRKEKQTTRHYSFQHHPSTVAIEHRKKPNTFNFTKFSLDDNSSELNKLDHTKSTTGVNIKLLKENSETCAPILTNIFNSCISN